MPAHRGPAFGARPYPGGVEFTLWAPQASRVDLELAPARTAPSTTPLESVRGGLWQTRVPGAAAGDRYRFRADEGPGWPDPASRFQPDGVHGASEVVDASAFAWTDHEWTGPVATTHAIYELHVGTFSPAGTFDGVRERLPYLADLGVTIVELMPVAEFPGRWNWGYDGGALFAPSHRYGRPDDLRRLVDAAHASGLAVLLDVVYNHLGPDGAYLAAFVPSVLHQEAGSPWGGGLDFDSETGRALRQYFLDNACHWIEEYHVDGLRLDATHAIVEREPTFVADLAAAVRATARDRHVLVIAEDDRNLDVIVRPRAERGWGLDGVWADDFHHQVHCHLTGERDGYYRDFSGTTDDIARTMRDGWFFQGAFAEHFGRARGTSPDRLPHERFVICVQNHDQVGNRALGDRLHHLISPGAFAAACALCLLAPETPLLFMGQEWAASSPFQYFTDHAEPLGSDVVDGRRREFISFPAFATPEAAERIPSPQAAATFERSRLPWDEAARPPHAAMHSIHQALLALRRDLLGGGARLLEVRAVDVGVVALVLGAADSQPIAVTFARLSGRGPAAIDVPSYGRPAAWTVALSTAAYLDDPQRETEVQWQGERVTVDLGGPGAVVLVRARQAGR